jgi:hypothetical protein
MNEPFISSTSFWLDPLLNRKVSQKFTFIIRYEIGCELHTKILSENLKRSDCLVRELGVDVRIALGWILKK